MTQTSLIDCVRPRGWRRESSSVTALRLMCVFLFLQHLEKLALIWHQSAAATCYANLLECHSIEELKMRSASVCAYCTDMGVELGAPTFKGDLASLLPAWHSVNARTIAGRCQPDVYNDEVEMDRPDDFSEDAHALDDTPMPNCVSISGMCHTMIDSQACASWWPSDLHPRGGAECGCFKLCLLS